MRLEHFDHRQHACKPFASGNEVMDQWLRRFAKRSQRDSLTRVFVLVEGADAEVGKLPILGYFALSMASVEVGSLAVADRERLPRYPVPAVLMTRLAIDQTRQGMGRALLVKAATKAVLATEVVAARLFVVDALNEGAACFYENFGFSRCPDNTLRLYIGLQRLSEGLKSFHVRCMVGG